MPNFDWSISNTFLIKKKSKKKIQKQNPKKN